MLKNIEQNAIGYSDGTYGVCSVVDNVWSAGPADPSLGMSGEVPLKSPFQVAVGDTIKLVYDGGNITGVSVRFTIAGNALTNNVRPTNGYTSEITATTAGEARTLIMAFAGNTSNTFVFTPHIYINGVQKA